MFAEMYEPTAVGVTLMVFATQVDKSTEKILSPPLLWEISNVKYFLRPYYDRLEIELLQKTCKIELSKDEENTSDNRSHSENFQKTHVLYCPYS